MMPDKDGTEAMYQPLSCITNKWFNSFKKKKRRVPDRSSALSTSTLCCSHCQGPGTFWVFLDGWWTQQSLGAVASPPTWLASKRRTMIPASAGSLRLHASKKWLSRLHFDTQGHSINAISPASFQGTLLAAFQP